MAAQRPHGAQRPGEAKVGANGQTSGDDGRAVRCRRGFYGPSTLLPVVVSFERRHQTRLDFSAEDDSSHVRCPDKPEPAAAKLKSDSVLVAESIVPESDAYVSPIHISVEHSVLGSCKQLVRAEREKFSRKLVHHRDTLPVGVAHLQRP